MPSTLPLESRARASTYAGDEFVSTMWVSKSERLTVFTEWSELGLSPASTSHLRTSVAPFQLTYTSVFEPPVDAIMSGLRVGRAWRHGSL